MDNSEDETLQSSGEYLTFFLADEEYGVDILSVRGIQGWEGVTRIPDTPTHLLGVINLRGAIVPVADLRIKFQLSEAQFGPTTVVIIVAIGTGTNERIMGIVVDAVSEVYRFENDAIQPNPEFGKEGSNNLVKGLASADGQMVIILDIEKLASDWIETEKITEDAA